MELLLTSLSLLPVVGSVIGEKQLWKQVKPLILTTQYYK
jgi:hypothetical protein